MVFGGNIGESFLPVIVGRLMRYHGAEAFPTSVLVIGSLIILSYCLSDNFLRREKATIDEMNLNRNSANYAEDSFNNGLNNSNISVSSLRNYGSIPPPMMSPLEKALLAYTPSPSITQRKRLSITDSNYGSGSNIQSAGNTNRSPIPLQFKLPTGQTKDAYSPEEKERLLHNGIAFGKV